MSDFQELELESNDLSNEPAEQLARSVLEKMNGVHTARITRNGIHIIYNPLGIAAEEIIVAMRQAGFTINYKQPG